MSEPTPTLKDLRKSFEKHQIGSLPKPTKKQTDEVKSDFKKGVRCKECGGWHHPKVVHLEYVGHAALTDRFLDVDPKWNWEPLASHEGLPLFDKTGGLWIKLTILGMTRLGYGNAPVKAEPGAREKEVIGDALRNAGMRFGAALDLWHKGDLHLEEEEPESKKVKQSQTKPIDFVAGINKCFESPDMDKLARCGAWLLAEKAPVAAQKLYQGLKDEFMNPPEPELENEAGFSNAIDKG